MTSAKNETCSIEMTEPHRISDKNINDINNDYARIKWHIDDNQDIQITGNDVEWFIVNIVHDMIGHKLDRYEFYKDLAMSSSASRILRPELKYLLLSKMCYDKFSIGPDNSENDDFSNQERNLSKSATFDPINWENYAYDPCMLYYILKETDFDNRGSLSLELLCAYLCYLCFRIISPLINFDGNCVRANELVNTIVQTLPKTILNYEQQLRWRQQEQQKREDKWREIFENCVSILIIIPLLMIITILVFHIIHFIYDLIM